MSVAWAGIAGIAKGGLVISLSAGYFHVVVQGSQSEYWKKEVETTILLSLGPKTGIISLLSYYVDESSHRACLHSRGEAFT